MSGGALVLGIACTSTLAAALLTAALGLIPAGHQLQGAAEAAALAAADAALGFSDTAPCTLAERIAREHEVRLTACGCTQEPVCEVQLQSAPLGFVLDSRSRAGSQ